MAANICLLPCLLSPWPVQTGAHFKAFPELTQTQRLDNKQEDAAVAHLHRLSLADRCCFDWSDNCLRAVWPLSRVESTD